MIQHTLNSVRSTLIRWLQTAKEREDYKKLVECCEFLENELVQMQLQKAESDAAYQQLHQRCEVLEESATRLLKEVETLKAFCDVRPEVNNYLEEVLSRPEEIRWIRDLIHSQAEDWVKYLEFHFEIH